MQLGLSIFISSLAYVLRMSVPESIVDWKGAISGTTERYPGDVGAAAWARRAAADTYKYVEQRAPLRGMVEDVVHVTPGWTQCLLDRCAALVERCDGCLDTLNVSFDRLSSAERELFECGASGVDDVSNPNKRCFIIGLTVGHQSRSFPVRSLDGEDLLWKVYDPDEGRDMRKNYIEKYSLLQNWGCPNVLVARDLHPTVRTLDGTVATAGFVMERLAGDAEVWARHADARLRRACLWHFARELFRGLECLHAQGHVHGDLHLDQVLWREGPHAESCPSFVLNDFDGLSPLTAEEVETEWTAFGQALTAFVCGLSTTGINMLEKPGDPFSDNVEMLWKWNVADEDVAAMRAFCGFPWPDMSREAIIMISKICAEVREEMPSPQYRLVTVGKMVEETKSAEDGRPPLRLLRPDPDQAYPWQNAQDCAAASCSGSDGSGLRKNVSIVGRSENGESAHFSLRVASREAFDVEALINKDWRALDPHEQRFLECANRHRCVATVGSGCESMVRLVEDVESGRRFAWKVPKLGHSNDSQLQKPLVLAVIWQCRTVLAPVTVDPSVEGQSEMPQGAVFPLLAGSWADLQGTELGARCLQAAIREAREGMLCLHQLGYVHGDLKPSQVLFAYPVANDSNGSASWATCLM